VKAGDDDELAVGGKGVNVAAGVLNKKRRAAARPI